MPSAASGWIQTSLGVGRPPDVFRLFWVVWDQYANVWNCWYQISKKWHGR